MIFQKDIDLCLLTLKGGGNILYPTDTIWGIGCDAQNEEAVAGIYALKKRSEKKSMIILLTDVKDISFYAATPSDKIISLIETAEKPLTIIFPGAKNLASNLINEDGTIAIRIVKENFCHDLIHASGKPLVSTSANISGDPSPQNFADISTEIKNAVDYTVHYKQDENKKSSPSRIIKWEDDDHIITLRD